MVARPGGPASFFAGILFVQRHADQDGCGRLPLIGVAGEIGEDEELHILCIQLRGPAIGLGAADEDGLLYAVHRAANVSGAAKPIFGRLSTDERRVGTEGVRTGRSRWTP